MGTYPARAIIWCHTDSCPPLPPESTNVSSNGIFPCPSVVRIMGIFYQINGAVDVSASLLPLVAILVAEAELGGTFYNAKKGKMLRLTIKEMGWK